MTVRQKAIELLREVAGLLEQLAGEASHALGDSADPEPNVDPRPSSKACPVAECRVGGDHEPIDINGQNYCRKCNQLLATEGT